MKEIPLTQGKVALVDDEDYERVAQYKWRSNSGRYAVRGTRIKGTYILIYMHKFILGVVDAAIQVDHKDHNVFNNQKSNLRPCSRPQNNKNRSKSINNTTGFKGVDAIGGKYRAQIKADNKGMYLGKFNTAEDAARAYDEAALKYHGEFAFLNFPK